MLLFCGVYHGQIIKCEGAPDADSYRLLFEGNVDEPIGGFFPCEMFAWLTPGGPYTIVCPD